MTGLQPFFLVLFFLFSSCFLVALGLPGSDYIIHFIAVAWPIFGSSIALLQQIENVYINSKSLQWMNFDQRSPLLWTFWFFTARKKISRWNKGTKNYILYTRGNFSVNMRKLTVTAVLSTSKMFLFFLVKKNYFSIQYAVDRGD